jgi:DNA-binding beta-propeller fold protein YncE
MQLSKFVRYSVFIFTLLFTAAIKTLACPTPIINNSITLPFENVFCDTGTPDSIKGSAPQGGTGVYSIKWLQSTDVKNFTVIDGALLQSFYTGTLLQTTYYKRVVNSGDCSDTSNTVSITINGGSYIFLFSGLPLPQAPNLLHKINLTNNKLLESISTPDSLYNLVISSKRNRLYFLPQTTYPNSTYVYVAETFPVLKMIDSIPVPGSYYLFLTPDENKLLVGNFEQSMSMIGLDSNKVINTFDVGTFVTPVGFSPDASRLYLYNTLHEVRDTIRVINTADQSTIATTPFLGNLSEPVISPDGTKIYALNSYAFFRIMNTADYSVHDMTFDSKISNIDIFRLSADGSKIYMMATYSPPSGYSGKAMLEVDTQTGVYRFLAFYSGGSYYNLEISADNKKVLVKGAGSILIEIDIATGDQSSLISPTYWWDVGHYATKGPSCISCTYNYWTGSVNSDWANPGNWNCNSVPGSTSHVVINSGTVILHSNATIYSLNTGAGANLVVNSGFHLTILH